MTENPQDRPAAEWPDGLHEALRLDQGSCCCYDDQEDCYSVGCHRPHGHPAGRNEGHCGGVIDELLFCLIATTGERTLNKKCKIDLIH